MHQVQETTKNRNRKTKVLRKKIVLGYPTNKTFVQLTPVIVNSHETGKIGSLPEFTITGVIYIV